MGRSFLDERGMGFRQAWEWRRIPSPSVYAEHASQLGSNARDRLRSDSSAWLAGQFPAMSDFLENA